MLPWWLQLLATLEVNISKSRFEFDGSWWSAIAAASLRSACWPILSWRPDGTWFYGVSRLHGRYLLSDKLILEPSNNVLPLYLLNLLWHVSLNELLRTNEATADPNEYFIPPLYLNVDTLFPEFINTLRLSQEENLHLLPLWEPIDEVCHCNINMVTSLPDVNRLVCSQMLAFHSQFSNLWLSISQTSLRWSEFFLTQSQFLSETRTLFLLLLKSYLQELKLNENIQLRLLEPVVLLLVVDELCIQIRVVMFDGILLFQ